MIRLVRRVGPRSFTEVYFAGCNPSFVETNDGYVMIDSPQQPIDAVRWRERMENLPTTKKLRASLPPRAPIQHAREWAVSHRPKY